MKRYVEIFNKKINELGLNLHVPGEGVPGAGNCFFDATTVVVRHPTYLLTLDAQVSVPENGLILREKVTHFMESRLKNDDNLDLVPGELRNCSFL